MKKIFSPIILFLSSMTFVSSAPYSSGISSGLGYGMTQLIDIIENLFGPLLYVFLGGGEFLFERLLFLLIIGSVTYIALSKNDLFSSKPAALWIVVVTVSLLATRFLVETNLVQTMILPYSVLGISITAFLPTIIYFFFVQNVSDSSIIRKSLWLFYTVVFIGIWSSRYDELGSISWIYFWTAALALIFFLFDGTIRRTIIKAEMAELGNDTRAKHIADLKYNLDKIRKGHIDGHYTDRDFKRLERKLLKQIKKASKA